MSQVSDRGLVGRSSRPGRGHAQKPAAPRTRAARRLPARVLIAAGLEPTGRAGLLADLWALAGHPVEPAALVTALTAQGSRPRSVPTTPGLLVEQLASIRVQGAPCAAKLGMVVNRGQLEVLAEALLGAADTFPVVVDPVVRSSRGQMLSRLVAQDYLSLAGPRVILTPNAEEAGWLLGEDGCGAVPLSKAEDWCRALGARGFGMVVVKGGHVSDALVDLVWTRGRLYRLESRRLQRDPERHRGTGCRFASSLAAALALGTAPLKAVRQAQARVHLFLGS